MESFQADFEYLSELLVEYLPLWWESSFVHDDLSWRGSHSRLHRSLLALSDSELNELSDEERLIRYVGRYVPGLHSIAEWTVESIEGQAWQTPARALFGLPERKRLQTEGFVSAVLSLASIGDPNGHWVDWCSGRGLLARQLYYSGRRPVHCLEIDGALCRSGTLAHSKLGDDIAQNLIFHQCDVLQQVPVTLMHGSALHTALHACGELHISMLRQVVEAGGACLACAPCCYHSIPGDAYEPLSSLGRQVPLKLNKPALRRAAAETCTANALERALRQRELLWRIAFDLELRERNGLLQYTPTPSVRKSILKTEFREFAQTTITALARQGSRLQFPSLNDTEEARLMTRAENKLARIKRLEKAQLGFRKALEHWLLLDRALFLQERGYHVRLKQFCDKTESARNVVILAERESF